MNDIRIAIAETLKQIEKQKDVVMRVDLKVHLTQLLELELEYLAKESDNEN